METRYKSWGYTPPEKQLAITPSWASEITGGSTVPQLPFGNGRSYGDSCLISNGTVLDSRSMNHILNFDISAGTLTCESGVTFSEIVNLCADKGWFLPVTPGTHFVSVGGAIANDVHGKNHHRRGTFGCHVLEMEIHRTDGARVLCSAVNNPDLFNATIGGLGLTGMIIWAKFSLIPIASNKMIVESLPFRNLEEFYEISQSDANDYEYSVAWLDCSATGGNFGRGIYFRGNHSDLPSPKPGHNFRLPKPKLSVPFALPTATLNPYFVSSFNTLYFHRHKNGGVRPDTPMGGFFYPLDGINHWNRIYGKNGFFQYQFVVPTECTEALKTILEIITQSRSGSFLAVLKEFGNMKSPGLLSFPKPGYCLALDFPNKGRRTLELIESLDIIVRDVGGSVYPAKDRMMSAESFRQYYPNYTLFTQMIDPGMSSDFWKRVSQ